MIEKYNEIIGVDENSSLTKIKKAYRAKAKLLHPDINKSPDAHDKFILLQEAYEYLCNRKTGKIYDPKKSAYTATAESKYKTYEAWQRAEREYARERARYYARMRYKEYIKTDFYKTTVALDVISDYLSFILAICVLIGVPTFGFIINGGRGVLGSLIVLVFLSPFWYREFENRPKGNIKNLMNSIVYIAKQRVFQVLTLSVFNFYLILRIGLNTLISTWTLILIYAVAIAIDIVLWKLLLNLLNKSIKRFVVFGISPGIISLFFLINFLCSSNPSTENYGFGHDFYLTESGGRIKRSYIHLEDNQYSDIAGIRIFSDFRSMENANKIIYEFEEGLFGIRVLKSFEFQRKLDRQ